MQSDPPLPRPPQRQTSSALTGTPLPTTRHVRFCTIPAGTPETRTRNHPTQHTLDQQACERLTSSQHHAHKPRIQQVQH